MLDAFKIFYFSFLPTETDRNAYHPTIKQILDKHGVDAKRKQLVYKIMQLLSEKNPPEKERRAKALSSRHYSS